jgi:hypothetical protein
VKKISILLVSIFLLSGCATYKFQHVAAPYDKGYVVTRDGETIPDYTIGKGNAVPDELGLAKKRFNERRDKVEYYYKQMGLIDNKVREFFDAPILMVKLLTGVLRLPFVAYTNYKYEHDPKYKAEVDRLDEEKDAKERQRIKALKDELNAYIQKELEKEPSFAVQPQEEAQVNKKVTVTAVSPQEPGKVEQPLIQQTEPVALETSAPAPVTEGPGESVKKEVVVELQPAQEQAVPEKPSEYSLSQNAPEDFASAVEPPQEAGVVAGQTEVPVPAEKEKPVTSEGIKAVIIAKPIKGYSPLKVKFSAGQSNSRHGRIISYNWDFGDGDTSDKPAPANIYWSATYGTRPFTVTLTVKDIKGNTATQTAVIEVLNK